MEKKYVNIKDNLVDVSEQRNLKLYDKVIVVDGSYMVNAQTEERSNGIDFHIRDNYELLTITRVNTAFKTDYHPSLSHILTVHNNCEITGEDGNRYYCSKINIIKFQS